MENQGLTALNPHDTNFDKKIMAGAVEEWLIDEECKVEPAPANRQDKNGLCERTWRTVVAMARSFITDMQMPRKFWYWAIRHSVQVHNYMPCKVEGKLTSPFELAHGTKPDYRILCRLFATTYFKHESDGERTRDGIESKSMQGILLGRSPKSNGYIVYCPHTKQFYDTIDLKIDEGRNTATAFGLKYDGGLFFGLYDGPCIPQGMEPYPEGTPIAYTDKKGTTVRGYVISTPKSGKLRQVPETQNDLGSYTIKLTNKEIVKVLLDCMHTYANATGRNKELLLST